MFSYSSNFKNPQIIKHLSIEEYVDFVKNNPYQKAIKQIWPLSKTDALYQDTKRLIPAVNINFFLDKTRGKKNLRESTGYLYIDIDQDIDISSLNANKLCVIQRSFGNKGYGLIIKVKGLNTINFQDACNIICEDLGITDIVDKKALYPHQCTVIPYDPSIVYNTKALVFDLSIKNPGWQYISPLLYILPTRVSSYIYDNQPFINLRTNNISDLDLGDEPVIYLEEGIDIIEAKFNLRKKIAVGYRKRTLIFYYSQILILNPKIKLTQLINALKHANANKCLIPLEEKEIENMGLYLWNLKKENKLVPRYTKRKIILNPKYEMSTAKKNQEVLQRIALERRTKTISKLIELIENWDFKTHGMITKKSLQTVAKKSSTTLDKYYPQLKSKVKQKNSDNIISSMEQELKKEKEELVKQKSVKNETPKVVNESKVSNVLTKLLSKSKSKAIKQEIKKDLMIPIKKDRSAQITMLKCEISHI